MNEMQRAWLGVVSADHTRQAVEGSFIQLNHGKRYGVARLRPGDVDLRLTRGRTGATNSAAGWSPSSRATSKSCGRPCQFGEVVFDVVV